MTLPCSSPSMIGLLSSPRMYTLRNLSMTSRAKRFPKHTLSHAFSSACLSKWMRMIAVCSSWPSSNAAHTASRLMKKLSFSPGFPGFTLNATSSAFLIWAFWLVFHAKWFFRCWLVPIFQTVVHALCSFFASFATKTVLPFASFSMAHQDKSRRMSAHKAPLRAVKCASSSGLPSTFTFSSQLDISTVKSASPKDATSGLSTYLNFMWDMVWAKLTPLELPVAGEHLNSRSLYTRPSQNPASGATASAIAAVVRGGKEGFDSGGWLRASLEP
mmetsp:Transcript_69765/g.185388  ORF Transcript_69765/g.185388 Transcript_69765/m.185388 type:complete len:272 (-) Transcript_69765:7-822(-)